MEQSKTIIAPELKTLFEMPANKFLLDNMEAYVDKADGIFFI